MKILKKIGILLIAGCLVFAAPIMATSGTKTLSLEWEHDGIDLEKFKVYYGTTAGGPYTTSSELFPADVTAGIFNTSEIIIAPDGTETTYYFVVTALDSEGNESAYSNEVSYLIDFKAPNKPFKLIIRVVNSSNGS